MTNEDHYNKAGFFTFLVVLLLNIVYFIYLSFIHPGVPKDLMEEIHKKEFHSTSK